MPTRFSQFQLLHRFLLRYSFYPVALASALAAVLLTGRLVFAAHYAYGFLLRNLVLAWLPYLFAMVAARLHQRSPRRWWLLLAPAGLWLLFFPNAPYMMTDIVHLWHIPVAIWWYDIGMVAAFAWAGCFLGVASLAAIQQIVRDYTGPFVSWLFALGALGLSGLGIYLGRFARLNSWDALFSPRQTAHHLLNSVFEPASQLHALGMSSVFAALLLVCYLMFAARNQAT